MIGIIDYGMGNLHSVKNAFDYISTDAFISDSVKELSKADKLILPGVGAFPTAMQELEKSGLISFIKERQNSVPLLGICLGMQLLFDKSHEFSECSGLSLIKGEVIKMEPVADGISANQSGKALKIPHMGWNELITDNKCALLSGIDDHSFVYFVHSYKAVVKVRTDLAAHTEYGGEVTAVVAHGNVFGTQFHPEKSGDVGLKILSNFAAL